MSTPDAPVSQTLDNLLTAYQGENNASIKYTGFALKAEVDGFLRMASLFRAVARAEQVHAAHHARIIAKMGGTPHAAIHSCDVKSTLENLESVKAGEEYVSQVMYPKFINEAEASGETDAVRVFTLVLKAEIAHARLDSEALDNLEAQRIQTTFYVCLFCGEVTDNPAETEHCPLCHSPKEQFDAVR
jgi:rubrerythrin